MSEVKELLCDIPVSNTMLMHEPEALSARR